MSENVNDITEGFQVENLPARLEQATFGSIEGMTILVTGANSKINNNMI